MDNSSDYSKITHDSDKYIPQLRAFQVIYSDSDTEMVSDDDPKVFHVFSDNPLILEELWGSSSDSKSCLCNEKPVIVITVLQF